MTTWRLRLRCGDHEVPFVVDGDPRATRGTFVSALSAVGVSRRDVQVDRLAWSVDDTEPIGASELHHGALVTTSSNTSSTTSSSVGRLSTGTYFVVVAGPASGTAALLPPGVGRLVGRVPGTDGIRVDDPLLSASHLRVELVADRGVVVTDLDSTNGSICEGQPFDEIVLETGELVHAGASLFAVQTFADGDRAIVLGGTPTGRTIHRQFREALTDLDRPPEPPKAPPSRDPTEGATWWRSLAPLVSAVGFAVVFGRWQFLLIAAFAPIVYALDGQHRKRVRRRQCAADLARHASELAAHRTEVMRLRAIEVRRARTMRPGGGVGSLLARLEHRRVWERRPSDPDFCVVTLGYAELPATNRRAGEHRDSEGGGLDASKALWQAPLVVDLLAEGPLSITGPAERATAVARSLAVDLTVSHAPVDVLLWVLTDETHADAWAFAPWLPHAAGEDGGARVASTPSGRSALLRALTALIDARRQTMGTHDTVPLPRHLVIVDGIEHVASADLAEILRHGPAVGVIGVVTDPTHVPEGVRGEIRLGRFADECSFRSVSTPRVDPVTVSQLGATTATEAALALAGLEALGRGSRPVDQVLFTEMVGFGDRSADEQVEAWRRHSPCSDVPVGVGMDGRVFHVDFVRHGPHGLIGGMTRSGKTEFLKTWCSSLALHNHPDDLAIAIIDFKGGVDHQLTARLPHVIALATNQDIDAFERTIALLAAEHERRERIFDEVAGVATLEGYRTAREHRPELLAMPRLLVVIDEFAELLETSEGKAQIGRLESFSRIGAGLGVHLLLLTQMFNSALPPTIDGQAGLRLCFKVQNPADSKIVLKSEAAAGISSATKGRGFARFQGGDIVEFQSARIGNEARRHASTDGSLTAHFVTAESLTCPPAPIEMREVPNELQDLHVVVETVRRAAAADGWIRSAVPWPVDLPGRLLLDSLDPSEGAGDPSDAAGAGESPASGAAAEDGVPIGVADDPANQRTIAVRHSFADPVLGYAGAAGSGHHDALITTAIALAAHHTPDDLHLYGIDLVGHGLGLVAPLPHVGAIASRDDAAARRILDWLVTEAALRRATISRRGAADVVALRAMGGDDLPQVVLLVLGLDRMYLHGEGTTSPLLAPMTTVVNEIPGTGIQVVFSSAHATLAGRIGSTSSRRLVFAANDPADYPAMVPRSMRTRIDTAMRCVDSRTGLLAQIAAVCEPGVPLADVVAALVAGIDGLRAPAVRPPRRFTTAPWPLLADDLDDSMFTHPPSGVPAPLPFGIRPDTAEVLWLDPTEDGRAFRIIGPPKSGRSNALAAIGTLAERAGWRVLSATASRRSPLCSQRRFADWHDQFDDIVETVGNGVVRPTIVLIDDAHRLPDDVSWQTFTRCEGGPLVTIVAGATDALCRPTGILRALAAQNGVYLTPERVRDAVGVGLNAIDEAWLVSPRTGIGVVGLTGEAHRVQFPLVVAP